MKFIKAKIEGFTVYKLPFTRYTAKCPFCGAINVVHNTEWPYRKVKGCKHCSGYYRDKLIFHQR